MRRAAGGVKRTPDATRAVFAASDLIFRPPAEADFAQRAAGA